jgi:hypothetical protein
MQQTKLKQLTENGLVLELDKLGVGGVSKRKLAEWRKEALLPDFDAFGRGLGKGQGKTESVWAQPDLVIEQAKWIQRMRAVGILHEKFHLNLWILDYSIHPEDVRDTLLEPLEAHIEMLEFEAKRLQEKWQLNERTDGILEDVINDGATAVFSNMEKTPVKPLAIPQEALEILVNILLNPSFNINLSDLEVTFSELEDWSEVTHKFGSELFKGVGEEVENDKKHIESFVFLLQNAAFIQHHFSLHQVEKAVRECTHKDLAEVQADLRILTKIVMIFAQTIGTILPHIKPLAEDSSYNADEFLPMLFEFAEYFILADISLRRNGYSQFINQIRGKVLDKIEREFNEKMREDFERAAPVIGQSLSHTIELVEKRLTEFVANSSNFQLTTNN